MDIRPIRTEDDYDWCLNEIKQYFEQEPAPGTDDARRFDALANLIHKYEEQHYPIPGSTLRNSSDA